MPVTASAAKTALPIVPAVFNGQCLAARAPHIDYELILDCVHCGLCTSACPTYVELGDKGS